ncbi:hypothetical protein CYJ18_10775 [Actinomyces naeslundii]|nr:hypothetical protein CYJ18_10775 [Actinomyces naeslundii]
MPLAGTPTKCWEPKTIRLRQMRIPAVIARHAYRVIIRHKADHPWTNLLLDELGHLQGLPAP